MKHLDESLDAFLKEEGIYGACMNKSLEEINETTVT